VRDGEINKSLSIQRSACRRCTVMSKPLNAKKCKSNRRRRTFTMAV